MCLVTLLCGQPNSSDMTEEMKRFDVCHGSLRNAWIAPSLAAISSRLLSFEPSEKMLNTPCMSNRLSFWECSQVQPPVWDRVCNLWTSLSKWLLNHNQNNGNLHPLALPLNHQRKKRLVLPWLAFTPKFRSVEPLLLLNVTVGTQPYYSNSILWFVIQPIRK